MQNIENLKINKCQYVKFESNTCSVDDLIEYYIVCNADFLKLIQRHLSVLEDFHACHAEF